MGFVRNIFSGVIEDCRCPFYRYLDDTEGFQSINCVRFGLGLGAGTCGDHELEVYKVHKLTFFPQPCGFWEGDYEYVTELPDQSVTETVSSYSPPCSGFPAAYRTKTTTRTRTIDTECDFGFMDDCCIFESNTEYGTECVEAPDPFSTTTYSGANTIGQHIAAGNISYYTSCSSGDCFNNGTYLSGPYSKFPAFMYGQNAIIKREGFFGLKATGLQVGLKYKYGYTVWRAIQPQGGSRSWTKVQDFRRDFIATSDEEEIDPIPTDWDTLTAEQRWFEVSGEDPDGGTSGSPTFTPVTVLSGYEYYVNNFGIIQDFGDTSCNAWITATDDGTTP